MVYGTEVSYTLPINILLAVVLQYDVGVDAAAVSPARLYSVVLTGFSTEGDGLLLALCLVEWYLKSPATFYGAGRHHRREGAIKRLLCNEVRCPKAETINGAVNSPTAVVMVSHAGLFLPLPPLFQTAHAKGDPHPSSPKAEFIIIHV